MEGRRTGGQEGYNHLESREGHNLGAGRDATKIGAQKKWRGGNRDGHKGKNRKAGKESYPRTQKKKNKKQARQLSLKGKNQNGQGEKVKQKGNLLKGKHERNAVAGLDPNTFYKHKKEPRPPKKNPHHPPKGTSSKKNQLLKRRRKKKKNRAHNTKKSARNHIQNNRKNKKPQKDQEGTTNQHSTGGAGAPQTQPTARPELIRRNNNTRKNTDLLKKQTKSLHTHGGKNKEKPWNTQLYRNNNVKGALRNETKSDDSGLNPNDGSKKGLFERQRTAHSRGITNGECERRTRTMRRTSVCQKTTDTSDFVLKKLHAPLGKARSSTR